MPGRSADESDGSSLVAVRAAEAAEEAAASLPLPLSSTSLSPPPPPPPPPPPLPAPATLPSSPPIARQDSAAAAAAAAALRASHVLGMGLVLLSTVCFSLMALAQSMVGAAVPSLVSTCVRFVLQGALTAASIAVLRRARARELVTWLGRPEKRAMLCRRGLWGVGGMSAYFYSLSQIPLSEATSLAFLNVPLTAVLAHWLCAEAYTALDAATAAVAFAGVVVITQPAALFGASDAQTIPPLLVVIILAGAVCSAMAYITVKQLGPGEDPLVVTLWFAIVGTLISPFLAAALQGFGDAERWDARIYALEFCIGFTGWAGQVLLNRGIALAPAGPAIMMRYSEIVVALVLQAAVLGVAPGGLKVLGSFMVMSCVVSQLYKQWAKGRDAGAAAHARSAAKAAAALEDTAAEEAAVAAAVEAAAATSAVAAPKGAP